MGAPGAGAPMKFLSGTHTIRVYGGLLYMVLAESDLVLLEQRWEMFRIKHLGHFNIALCPISLP